MRAVIRSLCNKIAFCLIRASGWPDVFCVYHLMDRKHAAMSLTTTTGDANIWQTRTEILATLVFLIP
ncbi:MAG: hypothetical protein DDT24_00513 [Chloroflexi bacterium]|nr:hypothetical protein [Chloroflexota bacterium]